MIISLVVSVFFLVALALAAYYKSVAFDESDHEADEYQLPPEPDPPYDPAQEPEPVAPEVLVESPEVASEREDDSPSVAQQETKKSESGSAPVARKKSIPRNVMNVGKKPKRPRRKN